MVSENQRLKFKLFIHLPFATSDERGFHEKFPLTELLSTRMNITGTNELLIAFGIIIISGIKITER